MKNKDCLINIEYKQNFLTGFNEKPFIKLSLFLLANTDEIQILKNLNLGEKAEKFCINLINGFKQLEKVYQGENAVNFFFYRYKEYKDYIFLLFLVKYKDADFIKKIDDYYENLYKKEIIEEPLLTGEEIIKLLNIKPSPLVGKIKKELEKKQIEGVIKTKEEAIKFILNNYSTGK